MKKRDVQSDIIPDIETFQTELMLFLRGSENLSYPRLLLTTFIVKPEISNTISINDYFSIRDQIKIFKHAFCHRATFSHSSKRTQF